MIYYNAWTLRNQSNEVNFMDTIGQVIKTVRKQKGLKQIDVAKEMTVSQSYISQIEKELKVNDLQLFFYILSV